MAPDAVGDEVGPGRRAFVRRLVIGSVFAAPVVSSFTMSGVQAVLGASPSRGVAMAPNTTTTTTTTAVPGASQPPAPSGFPSSVVCFTVLGGGLNVTVPDGAASLHLVVPPGALPLGTSLCIYRADLSALGSRVPEGQQPVSGYAVVWTSPGGGQPDAIAPITLTVTDPSIPEGSPIFVFDKATGAAQSVAPSGGGTWTVTFVVDPGFVVTAPFQSATGTAAQPITATPRTTG